MAHRLHHQPEEKRLDRSALAGAGPGEFAGEGVDAGCHFGGVRHGDGAGCAEERLAIGVALPQMVEIAVRHRHYPAAGTQCQEKP